jgi:hypothetical protein
MTYAVPESLCLRWRKETPQTETAEIANRDTHPFGVRTVRKHTKGNCNHSTPTVDYETCHRWRRNAERPGTDRAWTADSITLRDDVALTAEEVRRHLEHRCEHRDSIGYPAAPSVEFGISQVNAYMDNHTRQEILKTSAEEFRRWVSENR